MARGIGATSREVVGVEVGLLGYAPPSRVEQDERSEGIGIGQLQDAVAVVSPKKGGHDSEADGQAYCCMISSGRFSKAKEAGRSKINGGFSSAEGHSDGDGDIDGTGDEGTCLGDAIVMRSR